MASTTEAHSVSAKATSDITADDRNKSGTYGMSSIDRDPEKDNKVWAGKVNDEWVTSTLLLLVSLLLMI